MTERIKSVRDLVVYKKAFDAAMRIFEISKAFPKEEKYSLTDQIRRSSRSVYTNLSEAWRKRRYKAAFVNKLSDSGQKAAETQTWLEFSLPENISTNRLTKNSFTTMRRSSPCSIQCPKKPPLLATNADRFFLPSSIFPLPS
jgi:four helix bundle protein